MRVRRGLLFWGLLLVPLGGIPLLVRAGQIDPHQVDDAWRFWPLIVIGLGLLVLLSRTRWAILGTALVALTIGSIGGAALASGNPFLGAIGACGTTASNSAELDRTGTLDEGSDVRLTLSCGSIDLRTASGQTRDWSLHAGYRGAPPDIVTDARRLDIRTPSGSNRRQDWQLTVPVASTRSIDLTANAATSTLDLTGAFLDDLVVQVNAADLRIGAGDGVVHHLDLTLNAGRSRVTLGNAPTSGSISVNAGAVDLCVPPDVGLRFDVEQQLTFATDVASRGLTRDGSTWTRPASGGAETITLSVEGNAASFTLDPTGGC
jgi:hypothetical protein